jgi:hypothetical protein
MAKKEAILEFRFSRPNQFHCSFCGNRPLESTFATIGDVAELVAAFKAHVERYHPQGEDFSQAAARIVREATKD